MGDSLDPAPRIRLVANEGVPSFEVRHGTMNDMGYVARTWREVVRQALSAKHGERAERFSRDATRMVERLLPRCAIFSASPPGDTQTVYGFVVMEPGCVHLVYVKKALRRFGIGTALMEGTGVNLRGLAQKPDNFEAQLLEAIPMVRYGPLWFGGNVENGKGRRVVSVTAREGGIDLVGPTGNKNVTKLIAGPEVTGISAMPATELELDITLNGVVVRYKVKGQPQTLLVPMGQIRQLELA